jgi:hypothetical protein
MTFTSGIFVMLEIIFLDNLRFKWPILSKGIQAVYWSVSWSFFYGWAFLFIRSDIVIEVILRSIDSLLTNIERLGNGFLIRFLIQISMIII